MASFIARLKSGFFKTLAFLKTILSVLFGGFHYTPPKWWGPFVSRVHRSILGRKWDQFQNWKRLNPEAYKKRSRLTFAGAALLVCAGVLGKYYWDNRPIPDYVTFQHTAPQPTDPQDPQPRPLYVYFSKSVAKAADLNKPITEGIAMAPQVAGTWYWETDRVLVFKPDLAKGDWAIGEEYEVEFKKNLFARHLIFQELEFEFKTQPVKYEVFRNEFYIDPKNPDIKKVVVNLRFNYPVQVEKAKDLIDFELKNEGVIATSSSVPFQVTSNKLQTEIYLQSESLPVPQDSQTMVVKVSKGIKAVRGGHGSEEQKELKIKVPSMYEALSISSVDMSFARNEKFEPEQILIIRTSIEARSEDVAKKLSALLLPVDKPAMGDDPAIKNYSWQGASEVTPQVRQMSSPVELKMISSENEWSYLHTFKMQVEPQRGLYVSVDKNLKAIGGYQLKEKLETVLNVRPYPQEIQIMSQGSILTLSGDLKLPLLARNVSEVEFTLHRVLPEQVNHLLFNLNSDVSKPYIPYGLESQIAEKFQTTMRLKIESEKATQYFSFDLQPYLGKSNSPKGIFILSVKAKKGKNYEMAEDRRLVMVTDLGILVKESVSKNHEIFVQNFRTGYPVEGATVEVIGTNGLTILKAQTDGSGRATFPDLKDFKDEKRPVAFSVRRDQDQAFLPFQNSTRGLQYSRFDIGGLYENSQSDQLMSMVFSDRGIYRPGETVNLGLIIRSKKGKSTGPKPPLEWSVINPRGQEILNEKLNIGTTDLKDLMFKTEDTSPTGLYEVRVYLVKKETPHRELELLGTHNVRVEEFQPDRLKIQARLEEEKVQGWIKPQQMKAFIELKNMFGTAAENRDVRAQLVLSPVTPSFKDYKDYSFANLNPKDEQIYSEDLGDVKTNDKGEAEFELNLTKYQANLFNLRLEVEGFESEGGRSVRAMSSALVSPLETILGAKADGDLYYINKGAERTLHIIAIDSDLKLKADRDITLAVIERKYVSVLTQADDGTYKYQSVLKETPISEKAFVVGAKGSTLKLDTSKPGDYSLVFRNPNKVDLLKVNYTIVGESNLARALDKNAELQLSLNKSDFKNGEEIEMQIKAPYTGAGLITIERDGVYATKWFKTSTTTSVERIRVPDGLDGNAYVNVTFLRAIDSTEIYSSPLSYAVAPFSVSLDEHRTQIKLETPTLVKPGQKLNVKYSANKKTQIIVYGVDEGILQVARYKLPDPLNYFFQKRALQVKTYQMLDLLLPEFSILQQLQATGGDDGFGAIGKNINPFKNKRIKPVVFWSGVLAADATPRTFTYEVPETFNGNMRVMAVAASPEGLGSTQNDTVVRGDLIITPNVPMFVAPQDEFSVGVSISNQTEGSGEKAVVKLETTSTPHFQVTEGKSLELQIAEGREAGTEIKVKVLDQLGVGDLTFAASLLQAKARLKMEVSIRPATPYMHFMQTGIFTGRDLEVKNPRQIYREFGVVKMSASGSPFILATGLINYLESYPYGCTEQTISQAVPALILRNLNEFVPNADKAKESYNQVIRILRTRQHSDGGFAMYNPVYESTSNMAVSLYAAHYLIEAKAKGFMVPEDILNRVKIYLDGSGAKGNANSLREARRWAYALYLSARLGVVNGASLAQLRRTLDGQFKGQWEKDLTAIYLAGTYALYRQEEIGEKLLSSLELDEVQLVDVEDYIDPLVRDGGLLYIVGKHFPKLAEDLLNEKTVEKLIKPLNQGIYQTHSIGFLLLGFDALARSEATQAALATLKLEVSRQGKWEPKETSAKTPKVWNLPVDAASTKLTGEKGPLFYNFEVSGFDKKPAPVEKGLEITRQYRNRDGKEVSSIKIGEEVTVHLQARTLDNQSYRHVAIVDLIPSGFEMVAAPRQESLDSSSPQYQDGGGENYEGEEGEVQEEYQESGGEEGAFVKLILPFAYAQTTSLSPLQTDFVDEREDRMVVYSTVTPQLTEYTYRIKAVNKGKFVVPPPFGEGLYNRQLQYLGSSSSIEVLGQ